MARLLKDFPACQGAVPPADLRCVFSSLAFCGCLAAVPLRERLHGHLGNLRPDLASHQGAAILTAGYSAHEGLWLYVGI